MKKNKFKIIGVILIVLYLINIISFVYAKEYIYTDDFAEIKFSVDYSNWQKVLLSKERNFISDKWKNDNGVLIYGSNDLYPTLSKSKKGNRSREQYNDSAINLSVASELIPALGYTHSFDELSIEQYNLKFIEGYGTQKVNGISLDFAMFVTLNNGYLIVFQYYGDMTYESITKVKSIINSVNYTYNTTRLNHDGSNPTKLFNTTENGFDMFADKNILRLLFLILLTTSAYMLFPLIRLAINKNKFDKKTANGIAIWNSVIVALIFIGLSAESGAEWNAAPALFYYFINKQILTEKNKKLDDLEDINEGEKTKDNS